MKNPTCTAYKKHTLESLKMAIAKQRPWPLLVYYEIIIPKALKECIPLHKNNPQTCINMYGYWIRFSGKGHVKEIDYYQHNGNVEITAKVNKIHPDGSWTTKLCPLGNYAVLSKPVGVVETR